MNKVEEANNTYSYSWPTGRHYCIFKSSYGDCLDDTFGEPGYTEWGDRNKKAKAKLKVQGVVLMSKLINIKRKKQGFTNFLLPVCVLSDFVSTSLP